ncbi:MAG: hypothetical protein PWP11_832 [Thauera sp.]|nr:hypothetical protein [Thauera sp.]MDI3489555.1 hypothetical protein [Thauera sp.]
MAYYTGSVNSYADLRTALFTHAVADGWALGGASSDVLSKAGVYFQITASATALACLGCESNAIANPAPGVVQLGRIYQSGSTTHDVLFPASYEVFGFAQELYLVVSYGVGLHQWMAFGKSTMPLPGQGGWCGATCGYGVASYAPPGSYRYVYIEPQGGSAFSNNEMPTSAALFWSSAGIDGSWAVSPAKNCWVNHGLEGWGWRYSADAANRARPIGVRGSQELIAAQPSAWSNETSLLPVRCHLMRPSSKVSLIADLEHARHIRIDNYQPGQIITLGGDRFKTFPWFLKNADARDGGWNHSGTFGWAIRYEGP